MCFYRAILNLRAFAESWTHVLEMSNSVDELGVINYTARYGFICSIEIWGIYSTFMWYFVVADRSPLGVAGLIVPWNLPLYLLTFKVSNKVKKKIRLN